MRRAFVAALLGGLLLAAPAQVVAGPAITANPAAPTTTSGVFFTVTAGGGNRGFASIAVRCADPGGTVVYSTVLTVQVPAKGTSTSQTIYPPVGSCTADLVKLNQIGGGRVLGSTSFTVS